MYQIWKHLEKNVSKPWKCFTNNVPQFSNSEAQYTHHCVLKTKHETAIESDPREENLENSHSHISQVVHSLQNTGIYYKQTNQTTAFTITDPSGRTLSAWKL
jgi:hypothetical protein